jgi:hypothetical protein
MASLRLTFPEKDQPTVIALTGARLTIGRLPFNTIQIIDRTVSGFHAELISEHGHYRLHDRGSSNGTFVNGQKIADFHLNEACTITFGNVEAQFSPEAVAAADEAESFPTRNEINAVRQENADLKATVAALREEIASLRLARPIEGDAAMAVPKDEFEKVVVEREALKEAKLKQDEETARLKVDLAVLKRDRVNLQLAYDGVQRELVELRARSGAVEEVAVQPKAAAAVLAAQAPSPSEEKPAEAPAPAAPPAAETPAATPEPAAAAAPAPPAAAPQPPAATPEPPAPAARPMPKPFKPLAAPASLPKGPINPVGMPSNPVGLPKAPSAPTPSVKPFAPLPKAAAPAAAAAAKPVTAGPASPANPPAPAKAPPGLGAGIRAKPAVPLTPSESLMEDENAQTMRIAPLTPAPVPASKLPVAPTVKMTPIPPPQTGPKGTQKLS